MHSSNTPLESMVLIGMRQVTTVEIQSKSITAIRPSLRTPNRYSTYINVLGFLKIQIPRKKYPFHRHIIVSYSKNVCEMQIIW